MYSNCPYLFVYMHAHKKGFRLQYVPFHTNVHRRAHKINKKYAHTSNVTHNLPYIRTNRRISSNTLMNISPSCKYDPPT